MQLQKNDLNLKLPNEKFKMQGDSVENASWWQLIPYKLNPVIFHLGSFEVRYYGLMYIVAFTLTYFLLAKRIQNEKFPYTKTDLENYLYTVIIFLLIGGRLGYAVFYNPHYFLKHPLEVFLPFKFGEEIKFTGFAGMSYHGAVIGAFLGTFYFARKNKYDFLKLADFVVPAVPLGYTFGRFGNFFNGELYGRVTNVPWGMYFKLAGDEKLRHPSQLYEAFFEGIFIFTVLWLLRKKKFSDGFFLGLYFILYGVVRFFIEFVREPDEQLGFIISIFSMGQILCFSMIIAGTLIILYGKYRAARINQSSDIS